MLQAEGSHGLGRGAASTQLFQKHDTQNALDLGKGQGRKKHDTRRPEQTAKDKDKDKRKDSLR